MACWHTYASSVQPYASDLEFQCPHHPQPMDHHREIIAALKGNRWTPGLEKS
jgi:hypothetical protein